MLEHTSNLLFLRRGQQFPNEKEENKEIYTRNSFENVLLRKDEGKQDMEILKNFSSVMNSREFEEEVANLLLEFRHQETSLSPKRKSPPSSPYFESFSNSLAQIEIPNEEKVESPFLKRRKTVPTKTNGKEEHTNDFEEEKVLHFRRRKTLEAHEDSDSEHLEEEEEYEEEEEVINDQDEEYFDNDDDDWFESNKSQSPANSSTSSSSVSCSGSGRITRKKAPSGSACEKHKRWKKRCPDDCPMRTSKQPRRRKSSPKESSNSSFPNMHDEFRTSFEVQTPPRDDYGHGHGIEEDLQLGNARLSAIENEEIIRNLYTFVSEAKINSQPSKNDYVSLIRWSLEQLYNEGTCNISSDELASLEAALLKKITSENSIFESEMSGRSRKTRTLKEDEKNFIFIGPSGNANSAKKLALTSLACEKHTTLHARCPPNCTERRTVHVPIRGRRKSPMDEISNYELAQEIVHSPEYSASEQSDSVLEKEVEVQPSPRVKRENLKPKSKSNSKGRSGRKYLPQACDRHKLLHAKCPANCLDRIKRDSEMTGKKHFFPLETQPLA